MSGVSCRCTPRASSFRFIACSSILLTTLAWMNIHLSKRTRLLINSVGIGIWSSGAGWLIVHYLVKSENVFGRNPSEPTWLKIHGAFGFLAIWTFGVLWGMHIVKAWHRHWHRRSGGTLFAALATLIATGYLLYYVADEPARQTISVFHWVLGLLLPLAYLLHRLAKKLHPHKPQLRQHP